MKSAFKAVLLMSIASPVLCMAQANSCDAKRASIEQEITYARAHGNTSRIEGLETALARLNANCTDASLKSEGQRKVADAQKRLKERQRDLDAARAQGKSAGKIADRQRKVDEAHAALERAQAQASD
jgi:hypothetical protein